MERNFFFFHQPGFYFSWTNGILHFRKSDERTDCSFAFILNSLEHSAECEGIERCSAMWNILNHALTNIDNKYLYVHDSETWWIKIQYNQLFSCAEVSQRCDKCKPNTKAIVRKDRNSIIMIYAFHSCRPDQLLKRSSFPFCAIEAIIREQTIVLTKPI